MNILDLVPPLFHGFADYVLTGLVGFAAIFAVSRATRGRARPGAIVATTIAVMVALYWTHVRHEWTKQKLAESDAKVAAAEADVKTRDAEIAAHRREIAKLQTQIAAVENNAQRDKEASNAAATELDAQLEKGNALEKQIAERERRLGLGGAQ